MLPVVLAQAVAQQPPGAVPLLNASAAGPILPPGFIAVQPSVFWSIGLGLGFCFGAVFFFGYLAWRFLWESKRIRVFWRGNAAHTMKEEWVKRTGDEFQKRFGNKDGQVKLEAEAMMLTKGRLGSSITTWFIDQTTGLNYVFESNAKRFEGNPALEVAAQFNPISYLDQIILNRAMNIYNADRDPEDWKRGLILPLTVLTIIILMAVMFIGFKVSHLG